MALRFAAALSNKGAKGAFSKLVLASVAAVAMCEFQILCLLFLLD